MKPRGQLSKSSLSDFRVLFWIKFGKLIQGEKEGSEIELDPVIQSQFRSELNPQLVLFKTFQQDLDYCQKNKKKQKQTTESDPNRG